MRSDTDGERALLVFLLFVAFAYVVGLIISGIL